MCTVGSAGCGRYVNWALGSKWGPSGVQVGSQCRGPSGVPVGSQWGPSGVPVGSQWGPSGVPVGSQWGLVYVTGSQRSNSATRGYNLTKRMTYNQAFITKCKSRDRTLVILQRTVVTWFTLGYERLVINNALGYIITASGWIGTLWGPGAAPLRGYRGKGPRGKGSGVRVWRGGGGAAPGYRRSSRSWTLRILKEKALEGPG